MSSLKEVFLNKDLHIHVANNTVTNGSVQSSQLRTLHLLFERHIKNSPTSSRELLLQVTDESDPMILLSTVITEGGYLNLRTSQGLLVDFNSFPVHFSGLIEKCIEEQQGDSPKLILMLRTSSNNVPTNDITVGKVSLEVVELNSFKHLCHLSLDLTPASLQEKLCHLSSCIKMLKSGYHAESEKARLENSFLTKDVKDLREELRSKEEEIEAAKEEMRKRLNDEVVKCNNLVINEKEINLKCRSDFDRKLARVKRELEDQCNEQLKSFRTENASLGRKNSDLAARNKTLEESLRKAQAENRELNEIVKKKTEELENLQKECASFARNLDEKREAIRKMEGQINRLDRSLQETDTVRHQDANRLKALLAEKYTLSRNFEACLKKLEKRETTIQQLFVDFQNQKTYCSGLKERLNAEQIECSRLEKNMESLQLTLDLKEKELKKDTETSEENLKKLERVEAELVDAKNGLKEADDKMKEQENTIRSNKNVISIITKKIAELESRCEMTKKNPLAEAYLHSENFQGMIESTPPAGKVRITSTPASLPAVPVNFLESAQSKFGSPITAAIQHDSSKIPEEIKGDNKENSPGLDQRYLEPSGNPLPVRGGILRGNAVRGSLTSTRGGSGIRGQKKTIKTSAYFKKS